MRFLPFDARASTSPLSIASKREVEVTIMRLVIGVAALFLTTTFVATLPAQPSARFDMKVREDFFAGFAGDQARLDRAMKACDDALAANPDHAEALVWRGAGVFFQAGVAFRSGDVAKGMGLYTQGLNEMARAVSLAPDNVGVRIPRGAVLLEASRGMPNPKQAESLIRTAVDDYERALELQNAYFSSLSDHARGELLFGLADGWARLGDKEKAASYFQRLTDTAPTSGRVNYSKAYLAGAPPKDPGRCSGCH